MDGIREFTSAVNTHLAPIAKNFDLKLECIEERVFAMRGATFAVKIYFAPCHGHNITVCLSPEFDPSWNPDFERGLKWFLSFFGENTLLPNRVSAPSAVDQLVSQYVLPIEVVLNKVSKVAPGFWPEFYAFFDAKTKNA
jgi:hypothetical protein